MDGKAKVFINGGILGEVENIALPEMRPMLEGIFKYTISGPRRMRPREVKAHTSYATREHILKELDEVKKLWCEELDGTHTIIYKLDGSIEFSFSMHLKPAPQTYDGLYLYTGYYKPHEWTRKK